jgi:hypothetical protein
VFFGTSGGKSGFHRRLKKSYTYNTLNIAVLILGNLHNIHNLKVDIFRIG